MTREIQYQNLKWIDIMSPQNDELKFLEEKFNFHPLILQEIKTPTYHPLLESYNDYLFMILHLPEFNEASGQIKTIEIDFLITHDTLITVRYQNCEDFEKIFGNTQKNLTAYLNKTTGHLLHYIVKYLFAETFPELNRIKKEIDQCEDDIFQTFDEKIIERISSIKRRVLDFVRTIKPQKSIWETAPEIMLNFWGEKLKPYFSDLIADYNRLLHFAETHREVIDSLHLTSSSMLDNKRNYVIKILTIFTAIILPLSFFTSIYGMNLDYLPFAKHPLAFWFFVASTAVITTAMLIIFKRRRWI